MKVWGGVPGRARALFQIDGPVQSRDYAPIRTSAVYTKSVLLKSARSIPACLFVRRFESRENLERDIEREAFGIVESADRDGWRLDRIDKVIK